MRRRCQQELTPRRTRALRQQLDLRVGWQPQPIHIEDTAIPQYRAIRTQHRQPWLRVKRNTQVSRSSRSTICRSTRSMSASGVTSPPATAAAVSNTSERRDPTTGCAIGRVRTARSDAVRVLVRALAMVVPASKCGVCCLSLVGPGGSPTTAHARRPGSAHQILQHGQQTIWVVVVVV